MNWKEVPIPYKMRNLKLDNRGFPIPYVIHIDDLGEPHFKINDEAVVRRCLKYKLCAICGSGMSMKDMWLAGGPLSALHVQGAFKDTPMHYECGEYALKVCPYLAARKWNVVEPDYDKKLSKAVANTKRMQVFVDPTMIMEKPKVFCYVNISDFKIQGPNQLMRYVKPVRPYLNVEFWDKGEKLSTEEAVIKCPELVELWGMYEKSCSI